MLEFFLKYLLIYMLAVISFVVFFVIFGNKKFAQKVDDYFIPCAVLGFVPAVIFFFIFAWMEL